MNIFYLDSNPQIAAQQMCDAHVVKMPLEYTQMISTFVREVYGPAAAIDLYKSTHKNHPCNVWLRETIGALDWFIPHALITFAEFQYRYGKVHASSDVFISAIQKIQRYNIFAPGILIKPPPQCMPEDCRIPGDTVAAYRKYYCTHKQHILKWTKREVPAWINLNSSVNS